MNPPEVYMCSPSWTLLPPPSPYHPSGSSQCTSPKHPVSCIEPGLATHFIHDIIHVSMPFSQVFPPSPSPTESIRLFYTLLNCGVGEDSWESLGLQGDPTSPFWRRSALGFLWKEWCLSWNSSTLATSCEELTHWKRLWCWEGLGAGGEGVDRGWDGWMASLTWWMWVWVNSGSWWWTGRPGMVWFMGSQRVGHDWVTELNWTEPNGTEWGFKYIKLI